MAEEVEEEKPSFEAVKTSESITFIVRGFWPSSVSVGVIVVVVVVISVSNREDCSRFINKSSMDSSGMIVDGVVKDAELLLLLPPNDDNDVVDDDDAIVSAFTTIPEDTEDDDEVVDGDLEVLLLPLMPSLSTTPLV